MPLQKLTALCISEMADHFVIRDNIYRENKGSIRKYDRENNSWTYIRQLVPQGRLFVLGTLEKDDDGYFYYAISSKESTTVFRASGEDELKADTMLGELPPNVKLLREVNSERILVIPFANRDNCSVYTLNEDRSALIQHEGNVHVTHSQLLSGCVMDGQLLLQHWNLDPVSSLYHLLLLRRNFDGSGTFAMHTTLASKFAPSENTITRWVSSNDGTKLFGVVLQRFLLVVDFETLHHEIIELPENERGEYRVKGVKSDGQLLISAALWTDEHGDGEEEQLELIMLELTPTLQAMTDELSLCYLPSELILNCISRLEAPSVNSSRLSCRRLQLIIDRNPKKAYNSHNANEWPPL